MFRLKAEGPPSWWRRGGRRFVCLVVGSLAVGLVVGLVISWLGEFWWWVFMAASMTFAAVLLWQTWQALRSQPP